MGEFVQCLCVLHMFCLIRGFALALKILLVYVNVLFELYISWHST